jgi:superfamily I DNA and/or RNA helicase
MKKAIYLIAIMLVAAISVSAQAPIRHNAMQKPSAEQIAKQRAERMRKELALDNNQYNKVYKVYFKQAKEQAKRMEKMQKERKKFEMEMKVILNDVQYKRYLEMKRPARYNKRPAHKMGFNKPDGAQKPAPRINFKSRPMHGKPMQIQEEAYGDRRKNKNMYFEPKQDAKKSERK